MSYVSKTYILQFQRILKILKQSDDSSIPDSYIQSLVMLVTRSGRILKNKITRCFSELIQNFQPLDFNQARYIALEESLHSSILACEHRIAEDEELKAESLWQQELVCISMNNLARLGEAPLLIQSLKIEHDVVIKFEIFDVLSLCPGISISAINCEHFSPILKMRVSVSGLPIQVINPMEEFYLFELL